MGVLLIISATINLFNHPNQIDISLQFSPPEIAPIQVGGRTYWTVSIDEEGGLFQVGRPRLPLIRKFIEIPWGAEVEIRGEVVESERIPLSGPILPVQPPQPKIPGAMVPFTIDEGFYHRDLIYPDFLVRVADEIIIRGHRILVVEVAPLHYNPAHSLLIFNRRIRVKIGLAGADYFLTDFKNSRYYSPAFEPTLKGLVLNYNRYLFSPPPDLPIGYLIIVPDAWVSYLDPLVEWRKKKGYHVVVAKKSETGSTKEEIRDYISNAYHNWPIPPSFVLLVGDVDQIPYWTGSGAGSPPTDLNYSCVDGSDYFPDVDLSRFSIADTTQLESLVGKVVKYERNEWPTTEWLDRAYFIASKDPWHHQVAENTHKWCMAIVRRHGMTADSLWLYYGTGTPVKTAINGGRSWATYSGHGGWDCWYEVPFYVSDVHNLTNTDKVPFVQTYACHCGNYTRGECFSESWIRVGDRGAIGHIASSVTSYWEEDDTLQRKIFDVAFDTAYYWIMGMVNRGKYLHYLSFGNTSMTRRYFEMYNLIGDGSIDIYGDQPHPITVTHPDVIPIGAYDLDVTVNEGWTPVENALVGVRPAMDDTVFAGYTDNTGKVTIKIWTSQPETVYITVTGHNLETYEGFCLAQSGGVGEAFYRFHFHLLTPNPTRCLSLEYTLPEKREVAIDLYNCLGARIATLYRGREAPGKHRHNFGLDLPSGIYFLRFRAGTKEDRQKLIILR